jgi:Tfp pilus assembly protein PilO
MKPKQYFFALLGIAVVLTAGGAVAYYYASQALHARTESLRTKLAEIDVAEARISNMVQLKRLYQEAAPDLSRLDEVLPRQKNQTEIILQLEKLASNAGLTFPGTAFQPVTALPGPTAQTAPKGDALSMPITMTLTGTYDQLQAFLKALEQLGRYNSVSQIAINKAGGRILSFTINLDIYMKP